MSEGNIEPLGYFRATPDYWEDCAETDEGARPLYEQSVVQELVKHNAALQAQRDLLLDKVKEARKIISNTNGCEWSCCPADQGIERVDRVLHTALEGSPT